MPTSSCPQTPHAAVHSFSGCRRTLRPLVFSLLAMGGFLGTAVWAAPDLLTAEEAFVPQWRQTDAHQIEVSFQISPGYYLYRDKLRFSLQTEAEARTAEAARRPAEALSAPIAGKEFKPELPPAERKDDPTFGKVWVYHQLAFTHRFTQPIPARAKLELRFQGCADIGVCYPPVTRTLAPSSPGDVLAEGLLWYASRDPTGEAPAAASPVAGLRAARVMAPAAEDSLAAPPRAGSATFSSLAGNPAHKSWGTVLFLYLAGIALAFTACMYPLLPIVATLVAGARGRAETPPVSAATLSAAASSADPVSGRGAFPQEGHPPKEGHSPQADRSPQGGGWRALGRVSVYVQGMALTYTVIGLIAGSSGVLLGASLQNVWVLGAFALLLGVMGLSMLGLFDLHLPGAWQSSLHDWSARLPGGRFLSAAGMGVFSALLIGPCVAPPLAATLGYIAASGGQSWGDAAWGGALLYAMALGIGTPLMLYAVLQNRLLPRSGAWLARVRPLIGFFMLSAALWVARPILPDTVLMLALLILAWWLGLGIWYRVSGAPLARAAFALFFLLIGGAQLVGWLAGSRDPLQPLAVFRGVVLPLDAAQAPLLQTAPALLTEGGPPVFPALSASASSASAFSAPTLPGRDVVPVGPLRFQGVGNQQELQTALARAGTRPVLLDFYADWCVNCITFERTVMRQPAVQNLMAGFLLLRLDMTDFTSAQQALLKHYGLFGPPAILFFDSQGREIAPRLIGVEKADAFRARLVQAQKTLALRSTEAAPQHTTSSVRAADHATRTLSNDPNAIVILRTVN